MKLLSLCSAGLGAAKWHEANQIRPTFIMSVDDQGVISVKSLNIFKTLNASLSWMSHSLSRLWTIRTLGLVALQIYIFWDPSQFVPCVCWNIMLSSFLFFPDCDNSGKREAFSEAPGGRWKVHCGEGDLRGKNDCGKTFGVSSNTFNSSPIIDLVSVFSLCLRNNICDWIRSYFISK